MFASLHAMLASCECAAAATQAASDAAKLQQCQSLHASLN